MNPIPLEKLEQVAALDGPEPQTMRPSVNGAGGGSFDVGQWITSRGLPYDGPYPAKNGGREWRRKSGCEWQPEYPDANAAIIESSDGKLGYHCFCGDHSTKSWRDLREKIDGPRPVHRVKAQPSSEQEESPEERVIQCVEDIPTLESVSTEPIEWAVYDLIPMAAVTVITSESGKGKSTVISAIGHEVAKPQGGRFAGRRCTYHPVLILDVENPQPVVLERFQRLGITSHENFRVWGQWLPEDPPAPGGAIVLDWVARCDPKPIIIVDSFIGFHPGSENDSTETRKYMSQFRRLAAMGAAVVILHHTGKAETSKDYRGSSDIKASIDIGYKLTDLGDGSNLSLIELRAFKQRFTATAHLVLRYEDGVFSIDEQERQKPVPERLADLLREHPAVTSGEFEALAAARGLGRNRARDFLRAGAGSFIRVERGFKGSKLHHWRGGLVVDFMGETAHE